MRQRRARRTDLRCQRRALWRLRSVDQAARAAGAGPLIHLLTPLTVLIPTYIPYTLLLLAVQKLVAAAPKEDKLASK